MIRCVHCGTENEEIFTYCLNCGKPLEQSMNTFKARGTQSGDAIAARLVVVKADGSDGESFALKGGENIIGRGPVEIDLGADPRISAKHAMIDVGTDVAFVTGIDTEFGTFVRLTSPRVLADKDRIRIGHALLEYNGTLHKPHLPVNNTEWLGSPSAPAQKIQGRILRIGPNETILAAWLLDKPETVVGRTGGDIVLGADGFVSSKHASFVVTDNDCTIKDLKSTNGSFVMVKGRVGINSGDHLLIGPHLLRFDRK